MHISVLLLNHVNLAGMENARVALQECNQFLREQNKEPFFNVELVGCGPSVQFYTMVNSPLNLTNCSRK